MAQSKSKSSGGDFTFAGGLNLALPVGDFNLTHNFGIGVQLQGEYKFSENLSGVATTGYTNFFGKDYGGGFKAANVGLIPILAGIRYYPAETFFFGGQIGYGIFTGGGGGAPKGFDYKPQIGYNAENFQLIFAFEGVSVTGGTLSNLGLTGVYKFH